MKEVLLIGAIRIRIREDLGKGVPWKWGEQRSIVGKGAEVIMSAMSSRAGTRLLRRV